MNKYLYTSGVAILSSFMTLIVCTVLTIVFIIQPFNKEAVDRGFATWEVIDNSTGKTKFVWNEFGQALHPDNPANLFAEIERPLK